MDITTLDRRKFGNLIKQQRLKKHYSLAKIGDYAGVSKQAIQQYEQGFMVPSKDVFRKIVEILGLTECDLQLCGFIPENSILTSESEIKAIAFELLSSYKKINARTAINMFVNKLCGIDICKGNK